MATSVQTAVRPSRLTYATQAAPGLVNEDYVLAGPDWAVVLDGATAPAGVDSGCVHDVPWLVHRLAGALAGPLATGAAGSLQDVLAAAIETVRTAHAGTCDLANPDSPSSTVAMARWGEGRLECLVLADSPVLVRRTDGSVDLVEDDRLLHLPGGPPYTCELVRSHRNRPGGFWVASTSRAAAYEAVTATFSEEEVDTVALLTDGVTRLVERYGHTWRDLLEDLRTHGPEHVIGAVRDAERAAPAAHGKPHDDATALVVAHG
ncbi:protein phosphatase 2C domain-containing protein [Actinomadura sp. DC4]|uniref:protein phosphatase 2C domain-containing protein n=1 Tax=Actinomadura sp. DC4 TaxID=3055069 RepID=UPI0025B04D84|nr:protein phosphatase 2C domain-containing protein [Actinomadura sp. DC4]MDN3355313.1 protein phosphatase 2C domain-containing protein [Actinomadura sp. DC4]